MDSFDQKNAMKEIVDYWTKSKVDDESKNVQLTEHDVVSLFEVLEGHFLLRAHQVSQVPQPREEKGPLTCDKCGRMFDKPWTLERHQQVHLNTERFSCSKCDRKFLSSAGLTKHLSKHLPAASCSQCERQFTTQQYLDQHVTTHHAL